MAGSWQHCCNDDGSFRFDLIENMGDAHEACEQMHFMIAHMDRNGSTPEEAEAAFYAHVNDDDSPSTDD